MFCSLYSITINNIIGCLVMYLYVCTHILFSNTKYIIINVHYIWAKDCFLSIYIWAWILDTVDVRPGSVFVKLLRIRKCGYLDILWYDYTCIKALTYTLRFQEHGSFNNHFNIYFAIMIMVVPHLSFTLSHL